MPNKFSYLTVIKYVTEVIEILMKILLVSLLNTSYWLNQLGKWLEKRVKETEGEDNQHQQQKVEAMVISQDGRVAVHATAFREIGLQTCNRGATISKRTREVNVFGEVGVTISNILIVREDSMKFDSHRR